MAQAALWTLENDTAAQSSTITEHSSFSAEHGGLNAHESIIGSDGRMPADMSDFKDNGKYRSVVKIQARFGDAADPVWMMGTGWLVKPDLLVTAGHVVYDRSRQLGEAREIRCYIGYNGRASVSQHDVQARSGSKVVTTAEWLEDTRDRARAKDIAFIKVERPFTGNLQLMPFITTPMSGGNANLGVVGYPGDKSLGDEETDVDKYGAQMYEEFQPTKYELEKHSSNMLEYKVSTLAGQSGDPVIRRGNPTVVTGTHWYGGGFEGNSDNAVEGKYGNEYAPYITLFDKNLPSQNGKARLVTFSEEAGRDDSFSSSGDSSAIQLSSFLGLGDASPSLQATLADRQRNWQPLHERKLSLDDNQDLPIRSYSPPR